MTYFPYVRTAIDTLGYLKLESAAIMTEILEANPGIHPRALSLKFRKRGTQIPVTEKKVIGLRSNAFYSYEALATLTDKGRQCPLTAHEVTLLRAYFSHARATAITFAEQNHMDWMTASGAFSDCPGCKLVKGQRYSFAEAEYLPPRDCNREACAMTLSGHIDFLKNIR